MNENVVNEILEDISREIEELEKEYEEVNEELKKKVIDYLIEARYIKYRIIAKYLVEE